MKANVKNIIKMVVETTIPVAILVGTMVVAAAIAMVVNNTVETVETVKTVETGFAGGLYGKLTWEWNNGILTISGTGTMEGVMKEEIISPSQYPWFEYSEETTKVIITNGVTTIGNRAFERFHVLESVIIPNTIVNIGEYAFEYCDSLETINIPNSCETIGKLAFAGCHNLTIPYPNTVKNIGEDAFAGVYNLL